VLAWSLNLDTIPDLISHLLVSGKSVGRHAGDGNSRACEGQTEDADAYASWQRGGIENANGLLVSGKSVGRHAGDGNSRACEGQTEDADAYASWQKGGIENANERLLK
jgi:hypothetical protein